MQEENQNIAPESEQPNAGAGEAAPADLAREAEALRAQLAEAQDAHLRARAESENTRRRAEADVAAARKFALEKFSQELLTVKDSLEAALNVENATVESFRQGVELTLKQLASVFERQQIVEVNPAGEKFDPNLHQAISMVASDLPANTVATVLQKGYRLHERVLRPALVMVSKGQDA